MSRMEITVIEEEEEQQTSQTSDVVVKSGVNIEEQLNTNDTNDTNNTKNTEQLNTNDTTNTKQLNTEDTDNTKNTEVKDICECPCPYESVKELISEGKWIEAHQEADKIFADWRKEKSKTLFSNEQLHRFLSIWTAIRKQLFPYQLPIRKYQNPLTDETIQPIKIVFNIMIKNESNLLARCIGALIGIVDAVVIADTGSLDSSLTVIRDNVPDHIPLNIEVELWKNFGHNRTLGVQQAQRFIRQLGWDSNRTYILLIDADMVLQVHEKFNKQTQLTADEYHVEQISGADQYWNPRLIKACIPWRVVGSTHEYYSALVPAHSEKLTTLRIDDRNDGNNRSDKYNRDIQLLLQDLEEDKTNARAMFYLAQTYEHRNQGDDSLKAIEYYKKHIQTGSFEEEMWYSLYSIGHCYKNMGDWPKAMEAYLTAFSRRPQRMEPLYRIGKYYRDKDQHHTAMVFFQKAISIPYPVHDILFINGHLYRHELAKEMVISAFWAGQKELGHYCLEKVLTTRNVPEDVRRHTMYNARFYINSCPGKISKLQLNPESVSPPYLCCNPSLLVKENQLYVNCRLVNYTQKNARNYKTTDEDGIFRTKNTLQIYDICSSSNNNTTSTPTTTPTTPTSTPTSTTSTTSTTTTPTSTPTPTPTTTLTSTPTPTTTTPTPTPTLSLVHSHPINCSLTGPYVDACRVRGLEDARIFWWKNNLHFTCTTLEHTPDNSPRIALVSLDEKGETVKKITLLTGYNDDRVQKNWLPFVQGQDLMFVYGFHPFTVLKLSGNGGNVEVEKILDPFPVETSGYRGSCGPIHFSLESSSTELNHTFPLCGWLICVHEVHDVPEGRHYMHRWVWLNEDFTFKGVSRLFYFVYGDGVEMATGAAMSPDGKNIYVTVGVEDKEAYLLTFDLSEILKFILQKEYKM